MATHPFSVSDSREGVGRDRVETKKTRVERPMLETDEAEEAYFALQNLACAKHDIFLQRSPERNDQEMIKKWT